VKKAQMVYEAILGKMETDKIINLDVHLFHSRFTKIDRLTNEKKIESLYGDEKKSPDRPLKSILIATQVAEQSLDIDFDFLITDIAPVDLILQRAGRMFRHDRTNRNVNFRAPEIILLIPNDLSKLRDFASVYDKFTVLKTMHILSALNGYAIQLPFMYRTLVDTVYSDSIPESEIIDFKGFALGISKSKWEEFLLKKKKDMEELDAKGRRGLIPLPSNEYPADSALLSEEESSYWSAKTRDGEEKIGLIMIKEKNGILTIGESYLKTDLPDKIPRELAVSLAENTVEIGIKGFVIRAKKEKSLVGSNSILNKWQAKIDKVPQFKGNKFMLLNENNQANLSFSNAEFMLEYDSIMGLKIQKIK
jgi:CRISPR-associated endonuclease/helicase Cas3